jgi:hypothetical protein
MIIDSSLEAVRKMMVGYPKKYPVALYGPPMSGKSIFAFQEAAYGADSVVLVDTEGTGPVFVQLWQNTFERRFNKQLNIVYEDARKIEDLFALLGHKISLKISAAGKIDLVYKGESPNKLNDYAKKGAHVFIVDSISNPLRVYFPGGQQNFPARADAANLILNAIHSVAIDNDVVFFTTHHETLNPTNPYALPGLTGGSTIRYNFKIILYLSQRTFRPHSSVRDLTLVRYFNKKEWSESYPIILKDDGYHDITAEELTALARKAKEAVT